MTQPDKWDEIAKKLVYMTNTSSERGMERATARLVQALRDAEKAGMLVGLMKAGAIATLEPDFHPKPEYNMGYEAGRNAAATAIYSEATAIRLGAKETKE